MSDMDRLNKAPSRVRPLTEKELAQRAMLEQRLAGRPKRVDWEDIGIPHLSEDE